MREENGAVGFGVTGQRVKRKKYTVLLLFCFVLLGCTGCGKQEGETGQKLTVYTSIYPVYDLTAQIAGTHAEVSLLVPAGMEPHEFELSTRDMATLEDADVFVYCGAGMENWVDKTLGNLDNPKQVVINASDGIQLLADGSATDPHIWLSVANAAQMADNIVDGLCKADAANAELYRQNYNALKERLAALDEECRETLKAYKDREIVVAHASFGYFCEAYGLCQIPIEGLMADSEPDPAALSDIVNLMKEHKLTTVYGERGESSKVVDTVAKETGAAVRVLCPLETLSEEQMKNGEDYFSVMRGNLAVLKETLQ